ncbi:MAG: thermonuclease family protein [Lamprobacter sp.]|uniref:thermonuclease family protein n=1 Tax=Lamprobacter sp. TaxID=3100796 RepID=UPI002B25764B|nr:thermonuclease family protein [Lamprobacter sp.]MEA3641177.1 thermonuclease family protein [Lamprobacter sp.]
MTRRLIPWHRLLPRHHRLLLWWVLAGAGIALPWLIGGSSLPWLQRSIDNAGCRVVSIHDGDTLRAICNGSEIKVRLYCIDTPEIQQRPWGTESRDYLRRITPSVVSLRIRDTDRYGRKVAEVINPTSGTVLNRAMVKAGQAAVYRRYCPDPSYSRAEASAKAAGLGIWAVPGDHQRPWDFRRH